MFAIAYLYTQTVVVVGFVFGDFAPASMEDAFGFYLEIAFVVAFQLLNCV